MAKLPQDFPPAFTVHSFYRRAKLSGLWDKILQHMGCLLAVITHKANLHDTKIGIWLVAFAFFIYSTIKKFCADGGYRKTFIARAKEYLGLEVEIS